MKDDGKRYRRKPAEYTVAARLFDDAGEPVVRLVAGDFDAIEVPWDEFKRGFEAVEQGEGDDAFDAPDDVAKAIEALLGAIADCPEDSMVDIETTREATGLFAGELRTILAAARKSLAAKDDAERCRVGEWLPACYLPACYLPCGGTGKAFCYMDETEAHSVGIVVRRDNDSDPFNVSAYRDRWDDARRRWIADGRPTS